MRDIAYVMPAYRETALCLKYIGKSGSEVVKCLPKEQKCEIIIPLKIRHYGKVSEIYSLKGK